MNLPEYYFYLQDKWRETGRILEKYRIIGQMIKEDFGEVSISKYTGCSERDYLDARFYLHRNEKFFHTLYNGRIWMPKWLKKLNVPIVEIEDFSDLRDVEYIKKEKE